MSSPDTPSKSNAKHSHYREFLLQLEEIQRHKWIQSEKKDRDIGFEEALVDWMKNHRADWRKSWMAD